MNELFKEEYTKQKRSYITKVIMFLIWFMILIVMK